MRRRTLLVVLAGLAVVAAGVVVVACLQTRRITRENFDRVALGMSRTEVEAVLGPEGDYRTMPTKFVYLAQWYTERGADYVDFTPDELWESDAGNICVKYRLGRVAAKKFVMTSRLDQSYLDNLVWRAKRQWHRWFP
jgi:hypothetical protein